MIGYLMGLVLAAWMPMLDWLYLLTLIFLPFLRWCKRGQLSLLGLLFAFNYAALWGEYQLGHRLPADIGKVDIPIAGEIETLVRADSKTQRFELTLTEPDSKYPQLRRVRLTLYAPEPRLRQGDQLQLEARLQTPQRYLNDASPDAKRRALQRGIDATGYVREIHLHQTGTSVREELLGRLTDRFSKQTGSTLAALLLGEAWNLEPQHWDLLRQTGTIHLVVVSGLHLGVLTLAGIALGRALLFVLMPFAPRALSQLAFIPLLLALLFASIYLWIGGAGVALQRAWILVFVLLLGRLWRRTLDLRSRLNLALLMVTLLDPLAVLDLGFWLSFGLVWLLLQHGRWRTYASRARAAVRVQLLLSIALLPVLVVALGQLNLISLVSNLWAIPWISFGVMLLPILLPLAYFSDWIRALVELWLELFWRGLELFAAVELSLDWTPAPLWMLPLALVGVMLLLLPVRLRLVGFVLVLPLLLYQPKRDPGFRVHLLDVGQGQAAILMLPNQRWVYDTGPAFGSGFAAAQLTLIPTLKREPGLKLDGLIISHSDGDHAGGVRALRDYAEPNRTLSGQPETNGGEPCSAGVVVQDEGVRLEVRALSNAASDNDSSCVLLLSYRDCSLLIAGDITVPAELQLIRQMSAQPVTWLQLSHHGSKTSSSDAWLDFWQPQILVLSRGRNNHFGHPHPEVVKRAQLRNLPLLDTAIDGEIVLSATPEGCSQSTFQQRQQRYWY